MKSSRLPRIDWTSLLKKLTAVAAGWFVNEKCYGADSMLKGIGSSPVDLAHNAAMEFFRKLDKYNPQSEEECFRLSLRIMRNDFLDLIKKRSYQTTEIIDGTSDNETFSQLENTPATNDGFVSAEAALVAHDYYPLAEGEQELIDVIDAVVRCGCEKREDIADLLGITPLEVSNRREKIKYRRDARLRQPQPARLRT